MRHRWRHRARPILAAGMLAAAAGPLAGPALACGALVAPNGSVRLEQTTTFVAYAHGVEHYLTSFAFQGRVSRLGWIVPLPADPIGIREGGAWTLQRLEQQVHPQPRLARRRPGAATTAPAVVLQTVRVAALDITVIRGSGPAILGWTRANGFRLPRQTQHHLLRYAAGSPYFLAARYDLARARAHHLAKGDGTPLLLTLRVPHPWIPLEVLAIDGQKVVADLFLLTPDRLWSLPGEAVATGVGREVPQARGLVLRSEQKMTAQLHHDLARDRHMGWVARHGWLTYLTLRAPGTAVAYDLGVTSVGQLRAVAFGTPAVVAGSVPVVAQGPAGGPAPWLAAAVAAALIVLVVRGGRIPGGPPRRDRRPGDAGPG
ncbi:MAG TPA: DUF2330 domain-containing protein [Verrucomicrobiae bacterium]|nr:DUF2330 domain-containing protein [Verrucomicrobiae bacterium]